MQISFNTAEITPAETVALIGLLVMLHPEAVGEVSHTMTDAAQAFDVTTPADPAVVFAAAPVPVPAAPVEAPAAPVPAPPPAAVPAPPPAPAAPVALAAGAVLDKEGLPWDARIHATIEGGGGKITKDGVWRKKRDVAPEARAAVVAELKAALAAGGGAPVPPPPVAPVAAPAPPSAPVTVAPPVAPAPSAPAPDAAPVVPVAPVGDMGAFAAVMSKVTAAQAAGRITQEGVTATLAGLGLAQLRDLLTRPDLIPAFDAMLDALTA